MVVERRPRRPTNTVDATRLRPGEGTRQRFRACRPNPNGKCRFDGRRTRARAPSTILIGLDGEVVSRVMVLHAHGGEVGARCRGLVGYVGRPPEGAVEA